MKRRLLLVSVLFLAFAAWWMRGLLVEDVTTADAVEPVRRPVLVDGSEPTTAPEGDLAVDRVECPLVEMPDAPLRLHLVELDHDTMEAVATVDARIRDGAVRFEPRDADVGVGTLIGDGIEPKVVVWALGVCTEDVELTVHPHFDVVAIVEGGVQAQDLSVSLRCRTENGWTWKGGRPMGSCTSGRWPGRGAHWWPGGCLEAWLESDEPLPVWVERHGERFETVI